jgi:hypothetical protein
MKQTTTFILCLVWLLNNAGNLYAQDFYNDGRDTVITNGTYKIAFQKLNENQQAEMTDLWNLENERPVTQSVCITGHDSITNLLEQQLQMSKRKYPWSDEKYLESITCRNGIKVFLRDGGNRFQKYYPNEDIVVTEGCGIILNLATGKDDYDPGYTHYSSNRTLRTVYTENLNLTELQIWSNKQQDYLPLLNLSQYLSANEYFFGWRGNDLYYNADYSDWWKISIKGAPRKVKMKK